MPKRTKPIVMPCWINDIVIWVCSQCGFYVSDEVYQEYLKDGDLKRCCTHCCGAPFIRGRFVPKEESKDGHTD